MAISPDRPGVASTNRPGEGTLPGPVAPLPAAIKRISWGAVFAGAVVALVVQLMLNLLGLSIGLGAVDLAGEGVSMRGVGIGAVIWLAVATIVSFFAGGWSAGRLAGLPLPIDGLLHGFVSWAVASFVIFYLVFSGVGTVVGGALGVVQQGTELLARGIGAVAPEAGRMIGEQVEGEVDVDAVRSEVYSILRQTGREDLQPENIAQRARDVRAEAGEAAGEVARSPQQAEQEIQRVLDRLIMHGEAVASAADREAAVNVLVARTDMTEAEARQTVREYEAVAQDAAARIGELADEVGSRAVSTADDVIGAVSQAALWSFLAMLLGALAAAGGGFAGTPADLPASAAVRRE